MIRIGRAIIVARQSLVVIVFAIQEAIVVGRWCPLG
jgi:hypothetical protein